MSLFRKKQRSTFGLDLRDLRTVHGKATQTVKVKVVKTKKGEVVLKLTDYKFDAHHPLMDQASCGAFRDEDFHLREGDTVELQFTLDIPIKAWR